VNLWLPLAVFRSDAIIDIGHRMKGPKAIKDVLMQLPPDGPGIVIAQRYRRCFRVPLQIV
jgi:chemotaxis response regulator CheB